jgi:hypothetical protein
MIATLAVGSVGSDAGTTEALFVVTDGRPGSWLGLSRPLSNSEATSMAEACDTRRSKPMFCSVDRRPLGDCAWRSCTACTGIKSPGIRACRSAVKKAGISACHAAYALSTHCRTRSRIACQCRSLWKKMRTRFASLP